MNCRKAQHLIADERDGALSPTQRAALDSHAVGCADCRRARALLARAADAWREKSVAVAVPSADDLWRSVRREIRGESNASSAHDLRWLWSTGMTGSLAGVGAAALAFAGWLTLIHPHGPPADDFASLPRAEYVEVADANASPTVFVDDQSGWLVVWAQDDSVPADKKGG